MNPIVKLALSIRQPWAWCVIHGPKTRDEYEEANAFMARQGVRCPRPNELVRGAIIGAVTVTEIVLQSDSPWFFGPRGLVLTDKEACEPIPCVGALGYFKWKPGGQLMMPARWMTTWPNEPGRASDAPKKKLAETPLFEDGR